MAVYTKLFHVLTPIPNPGNPAYCLSPLYVLTYGQIGQLECFRYLEVSEHRHRIAAQTCIMFLSFFWQFCSTARSHKTAQRTKTIPTTSLFSRCVELDRGGTLLTSTETRLETTKARGHPKREWSISWIHLDGSVQVDVSQPRALGCHSDSPKDYQHVWPEYCVNL